MSTNTSGDIFQPDDVLNNTYKIEAILGRGGTSEVYKARSEISGRVMAIKALRAEFASNEDFLALMTREEDIRDVRHDAIVRYFDTQRMPNGVVYLVMEHVDGPGLDQKLKSGGMPASDLLVVGQRVCEGLIAAHSRNIVHRDLSPDNIILRDDKPSDAVIIDFGIAKDTNPGAETIVGNEFAGKYAYAAPEQLSGQTDPRSDIYSLGALLLSTFRGAKPDIGNNPMEVVQKKSEPLDLSGVPDPLARLIAKMAHPDPAKRFQTAQELLAGFKNPDSVEAIEDDIDPVAALLNDSDDATVIKPAAKPKSEAATPAVKKEKSGGGILLPILGVVLLGGLGAGAYFGGFLDAGYPKADPFTFSVEKSFDGQVVAEGNLPSPEVETALNTTMDQVGGVSQVTLSSGDIADGWGAGVLEALDIALPMDEFAVSVNGNTMSVTGLANSFRQLDEVMAAYEQGVPGAFDLNIDIGLGPRFLSADQLLPILGANSDCGPLQLQSPPPIGYGFQDQIIVTGRFASENTRANLAGDIGVVAGERPVRIEAEILNESLCRIDGILPNAAPGGFDVRMGHGNRVGENYSGVYKVGENPTIDIKLPEGKTDGYLWVSVVDVQGIVFHLLPNRGRPDNALVTLQEEAEDGYLRVAFGLDEANGRLAFEVDDSVLGKSKVLVLHSDGALFDEMRPTSESAASYAEALIDARNTMGFFVDSLDSALLTTTR
ncbi:MAG: protein kinase [Pseudomonadota bacterium]